MIKKVIDISHWNGELDFAKIKSDGIDGIYIKCTDGVSFVDPMCLKYATGAKAQGIAVGYYHFAEPGIDPITQAIFFKGRLSTLPQSDLMPVLDIEKDTTVNVQDWINKFYDAFVEPLMLYSYQPYLDLHNVSVDCPLWLAQYRDETSPVLPKGWPTCDLWQYSNVGVEDGITVKVDEDRVFTQAFVLNNQTA